MAGKLSKTKLLRICDELATGKSLRSVCDNDDTQPHWVTVLQAVQRDEELYEMYAKARAIGAEVLADEMHDLARQPLPDDLDPRHMNAEVQRRRLEVDTLKWTFARQQPRGVRHKKEDVDNQSGTTVLVWGGGEDEALKDRPSAEVIQLVKDDDAEKGGVFCKRKQAQQAAACIQQQAKLEEGPGKPQRSTR